MDGNMKLNMDEDMNEQMEKLNMERDYEKVKYGMRL